MCSVSGVILVRGTYSFHGVILSEGSALLLFRRGEIRSVETTTNEKTSLPNPPIRSTGSAFIASAVS
jgi:hypothetical protein